MSLLRVLGRGAAALLLCAGGGGLPCRAGTYYYAGYTPLHTHGGEAAEITAPGCAVRIARAGDHSAAYVDVSNDDASRWGQTGWWLGTSPFGVPLRRPEAYWETKGADGTYRWQDLGPAPAAGRYAVHDTGLVLRQRSGPDLHLFAIAAPGLAAPIQFAHPAATDWNAGLGEVYIAGPPAAEPMGPARFGGVRLWDGGRWRLWTPRVDGASRSGGHGFAVHLMRRWSRWRVGGRLS
jgi:hypothetical protein